MGAGWALTIRGLYHAFYIRIGCAAWRGRNAFRLLSSATSRLLRAAASARVRTASGKRRGRAPAAGWPVRSAAAGRRIWPTTTATGHGSAGRRIWTSSWQRRLRGGATSASCGLQREMVRQSSAQMPQASADAAAGSLSAVGRTGPAAARLWTASGSESAAPAVALERSARGRPQVFRAPPGG